MARGDTDEMSGFLTQMSRNPAIGAYLDHMLDGAGDDCSRRRVILSELLNLALFPPKSSGNAVRLSLDALVMEDLPVAQSRFEKRFPSVFPMWQSVACRETDPVWKAWAEMAATKLAFVYLMEGR